jgi:AraC-like DNA-binding protein
LSPAIPLIRVAPVRAFAERLRSWGAPVERLLERARLSPRILGEGDGEALVPLVAVARWLDDAARSQGMDDLGVRLGASGNVLQLGLFGRMLVSEATLGQGLARAFRVWSAFDSGERSWMTRRGDAVELHHRYLHADAPSWEQGTAVMLALYLGHIASAAGPEWYPTAVSLPLRALPGARSLPLLANARLEFGCPWTRVALPAWVLDRPLPDPRGSAHRIEDGSWGKDESAGDLGVSLRRVVTGLLPDGCPDVRLVAGAVGMSIRTLQRRLHAERLTFAGVVAAARFAEARRMLRDPRRKIIDIALDLGYSDPSHFTRAFERWAGMAPREFRRRAIAATDGRRHLPLPVEPVVGAGP